MTAILSYELHNGERVVFQINPYVIGLKIQPELVEMIEAVKKENQRMKDSREGSFSFYFMDILLANSKIEKTL